MEYQIKIGDKSITLVHDDVDSVINVDEFTKIDTSNLFGEAVTIPALINRIGLMRAELESVVSNLKLDKKVYEKDFIKKVRKQAASNSGHYLLEVDDEFVKVKLTETGIKDVYEGDKGWVKIFRDLISAEKDLGIIDSLYESLKDKSRHVKNATGGTTPEAFLSGLVEAKVNGFFIKK